MSGELGQGVGEEIWALKDKGDQFINDAFHRQSC